jgi:hypothetical protein
VKGRLRVSDLRKEFAATREALDLSEKLRKGLFLAFQCVQEERDALRRRLEATEREDTDGRV